MGKVTQRAQEEPEPPAGNGPQHLFTAQSNPPLKRQGSLAGVRQAQLPQHPNSPRALHGPSTVLLQVGPAAPRKCLCVWVHVCVCVHVWMKET